jgi:hypothetical protein
MNGWTYEKSTTSSKKGGCLCLFNDFIAVIYSDSILIDFMGIFYEK